MELEADYLVLVHILEKKVEVPWCIAYEVREIMQLMTSIEYRIFHTYKENNRGADFMANIGCREGKTLQFSCFEDLPKEMRGVVKVLN